MTTESSNSAAGEMQREPRGLRRLMRDEAGLNIIEIVLIIFVAAVILLGLFMFFNETVYTTVTERIEELLDIEIDN